MAHEENLLTRKLQEFLSDEDIQKVLIILENLCFECWDSDKNCRCWDDE